MDIAIMWILYFSCPSQHCISTLQFHPRLAYLLTNTITPSKVKIYFLLLKSSTEKMIPTAKPPPIFSKLSAAHRSNFLPNSSSDLILDDVDDCTGVDADMLEEWNDAVFDEEALMQQGEITIQSPKRLSKVVYVWSTFDFVVGNLLFAIFDQNAQRNLSRLTE